MLTYTTPPTHYTAQEVDAAKTMAPRGALLIGTAHGNNLGDILANSVLNPLVGGIREVTLGDVEAKASNSGQKVCCGLRGLQGLKMLLMLWVRAAV